MAPDTDFYIRTQYDGKDLMSVQEIYYIDEDGDEHISEQATKICVGINSCGDQGTDLWSWLRETVELRLKGEGVLFQDLFFEDERGNQ